MTKKKTKVEPMTLTYAVSKARGMLGALRALAQVPLSARLGYGIKQCIREFEPHEKAAVDSIKELAEKYGCDVTGNNIKLPEMDEAKVQFADEMEDLLSAEVSVTVRPMVLPPECLIPAAVLCDLEDFVTVDGFDVPEPREPNPLGPDGKPMSDGEWAQQRIEETEAAEDKPADLAIVE